MEIVDNTSKSALWALSKSFPIKCLYNVVSLKFSIRFSFACMIKYLPNFGISSWNSLCFLNYCTIQTFYVDPLHCKGTEYTICNYYMPQIWHAPTTNIVTLPNFQFYQLKMKKILTNQSKLICCRYVIFWYSGQACNKWWNFDILFHQRMGMTWLLSSNIFAKISIILSFILEGPVVSKSNTPYKVDSDMYWCVILFFWALFMCNKGLPWHTAVLRGILCR